MTVSHKFALLFSAASLLVASPVFAADEDDAGTTKKKEDEKPKDTSKRWGVSASLSNRIGQGTFVSINEQTVTEDGAPIDTVGADDADNAFDRVVNGYTLGASYRFPFIGDQSITASTSFAWSHYLTEGGGINGPNEVRFQDIGLRADWSGITIPTIDTAFSAGLGFSLPTAKTSRISNKIVGTSLNLNLSKTFFRKLTLSLGVTGGKAFHSKEFPTVDLDSLEAEALSDGSLAEPIIFREGENAISGVGSESSVQIAGINGEYSLGFNLAASFPIIEKLRGSASYGMTTFWSYNRDNDDVFTPNVRDSTGSDVIDRGRGTSQSTVAGIGLSYPILSDWNGFSMSLSASAVTSQRPKTDDNQSFNFPFWNVNGAANNRSAFRFALSASY